VERGTGRLVNQEIRKDSPPAADLFPADLRQALDALIHDN
jgi:hypothetical protein